MQRDSARWILAAKAVTGTVLGIVQNADVLPLIRKLRGVVQHQHRAAHSTEALAGAAKVTRQDVSSVICAIIGASYSDFPMRSVTSARRRST